MPASFSLRLRDLILASMNALSAGDTEMVVAICNLNPIMLHIFSSKQERCYGQRNCVEDS